MGENELRNFSYKMHNKRQRPCSSAVVLVESGNFLPMAALLFRFSMYLPLINFLCTMKSFIFPGMEEIDSACPTKMAEAFKPFGLFYIIFRLVTYVWFRFNKA
jgi:hypothetical protein